MKVIINLVVSIASLLQLFVSVFEMFNMKRPESLGDSIYNDFVLIGCFSSFVIGLIFIQIYNFRCKFLESKIINFAFLVLALFASYVHIYRILVQKDLMLTSGILFFVDIYVGITGIKMIIRNKSE